MVAPFAVRLKIADTQTSGRTAGNLYAISTIGSIVGTFLAGFALIAWLGSTNILYPDVRVDVVELDPGVTALAREHFDLKDHPRQRIVAEDARTFLNRNRETYDAILCDTFNSHYAIPFHLTTLEAAQRMHAALAPNGVVLVNLISALNGERGRLFDAMFATYKRVFPRVLAFAVRNPQDGSSWQNIILAAFAAPDEPLLTDPDPDMAAMLAKRLDIPAGAGVAPLTDDYAPVDRYIMSAW